MKLIPLWLTLSVCFAFMPKPSPPAKRPNVIYIMADDLGYGDLGCFGQKRIRTPRLDQMAREGLRLTDHYAGSTVCAPSRCSLMTGLHQGHASVRGNKPTQLLPGDFTLANLFKQSGYRTGLIGKWGLGEVGTPGDPNKVGFDYYYGYLDQIRAHNYYPDYLHRNGEKVLLKNKVITQQTGYAAGVGQAATEKVEYSHDLFVTDALKFIDEARKGPFFLYLAFTIPHINNEGTLVAKHGMEVPSLGQYEKEDWPDVEKSKAAMISRLDASVGQLLDHLKKLGLDENTVVIFTSDNGPHKEGVMPEFFDSNGPLRGIKRDLYEGGIRVPFIARWPGTIPKGTESAVPVASFDMMATFADLTNTRLARPTDGVSVLPVLKNPKARFPTDRTLYWEFEEGPNKGQAVRKGHWKLVYRFEPKVWELYDLATDLGEKTNVIDQHPDVAAALKKEVQLAHVKNDRYPLPVDQ